MRGGQRLMLAQEIDEVQPRLDLRLNAAAVDGERQRLHDALAWLLAWLAARFSATRARLRMYSSGHVLSVEKLEHGALVQAVGDAGPECSTEQRGCVGNDNGRGLDRTDHGAEPAARRIVQHAADRVREFAGLLAELVEASARADRKLRHAHGADQFVAA